MSDRDVSIVRRAGNSRGDAVAGAGLGDDVTADIDRQIAAGGCRRLLRNYPAPSRRTDVTRAANEHAAGAGRDRVHAGAKGGADIAVQRDRRIARAADNAGGDPVAVRGGKDVGPCNGVNADVAAIAADRDRRARNVRDGVGSCRGDHVQVDIEAAGSAGNRYAAGRYRFVVELNVEIARRGLADRSVRAAAQGNARRGRVARGLRGPRTESGATQHDAGSCSTWQ